MAEQFFFSLANITHPLPNKIYHLKKQTKTHNRQTKTNKQTKRQAKKRQAKKKDKLQSNKNQEIQIQHFLTGVSNWSITAELLPLSPGKKVYQIDNLKGKVVVIPRLIT